MTISVTASITIKVRPTHDMVTITMQKYTLDVKELTHWENVVSSTREIVLLLFIYNKIF